jgi:hypothetical protein
MTRVSVPFSWWCPRLAGTTAMTSPSTRGSLPSHNHPFTHTRLVQALVPLLSNAGITAISIGANDGSTPPSVRCSPLPWILSPKKNPLEALPANNVSYALSWVQCSGSNRIVALSRTPHSIGSHTYADHMLALIQRQCDSRTCLSIVPSLTDPTTNHELCHH